MKLFNIFMIAMTVLMSCGAADGPDAPEDVELDVVSQPLDPLTQISRYHIVLFAADSIETLVFAHQVKSGAKISMTFTAPGRAVEVDTTTETSGRYLYVVKNENVGYTREDDKWRAYLEFNVWADPGLYEVRIKAIGSNQKHGKLSAPGKNYIRVTE